MQAARHALPKVATAGKHAASRNSGLQQRTKGVVPLRHGLDAARVGRRELAQAAQAGRVQALAQQLADARHLQACAAA
jgi:hypothetical protein